MVMYGHEGSHSGASLQAKVSKCQSVTVSATCHLCVAFRKTDLVTTPSLRGQGHASGVSRINQHMQLSRVKWLRPTEIGFVFLPTALPSTGKPAGPVGCKEQEGSQTMNVRAGGGLCLCSSSSILMLLLLTP